MVDLILTTFDWVPDMPRGYVRDIRVRWALERFRPDIMLSTSFGVQSAVLLHTGDDYVFSGRSAATSGWQTA